MITAIIERILCRIGLHHAVTRQKWTPHIAAKIVTKFEQDRVCSRCGKVLSHFEEIFDPNEAEAET